MEKWSEKEALETLTCRGRLLLRLLCDCLLMLLEQGVGDSGWVVHRGPA